LLQAWPWWCLTPVAIKKAQAFKDEIKANLKPKEDTIDTHLQTQNTQLIVLKCLQVIDK